MGKVQVLAARYFRPLLLLRPMCRFPLFPQAAVSPGARHRPYHQVVALQKIRYHQAVQAAACQYLQHHVLPAAFPAAKKAAVEAVPRPLQNPKSQDLHPSARIHLQC